MRLWNVPKEPPHYLPREDELNALRTKLLGEQSVVMTAAVTIQGMGGLGKSVLAAAIAQDSEIQRAFPDGIFWVTVGQEGKLLELQTSLAKELSGKPPEFTTVQQGQMELRSLLSDQLSLLILDDIWREVDLAALNVVGARGRLLVTTRDARIATSIGATVHQLDVLEASQARQLLAQWTGLQEATLPGVADQVVRECGALPLALAMVGAMLRRHPDRWENVLNKLRNADLEKIRQQFPDYPYPDLLKAMQVSVEAMEAGVRSRYLEFAVFPEDVPIPERVLQVWWGAKGLDEYDTQDVIDELKDRSLLQKDEQGRLTLHDLQMDFVRKQVGQELGQLHRDWIEAYRGQCPQEWHGLSDDGYCFVGVPYHLQQAGAAEELRELLLDFRWLQAKLGATTINQVVRDYELLPEEQTLTLVRNSLRLSAHVLADDKAQLAGHLLGHLLGREQPEIQALVQQSEKSCCGFRPMHANLTPPDGPLLRTLEGHYTSVLSVVVLPDGKGALSASNDGTLKLWDLESGTVLRTMEGHRALVYSAVAVLPDGKRALSASYDGTLKLWNLESGTVLRTMEGHRALVYSAVAVLPDGKRALSASYDGTLKLWNLESGTVLRTMEGHRALVYSAVAVLPDGKRALSASYDGTLKLWNLESGTVLRILEGHRASVNSVAVLPDGKCALSASHDGTLKLWNLESGTVLRILEGHRASVNSVAVLPDGKCALSASHDGTLKLWNLESGTVLRILEGHRASVNSVAVLPDGKCALSASHDGTLKLWNLESGTVLRILEGHRASVNSVAVLPDGKCALSASHDYTLKLWDLESGTVLRTMEGHRAPVNSVAVLPDGKRALSASHDGTLKLWNLKSGTVLRILEGHYTSINSVAVLPDGKRALSASHDGTLKLWNLESGRALRILEGHRASVNSVAVLPDGKCALSASHDYTLKLWDLESGTVLRILKGHRTSVNSVAVLPDGKCALSASHDGTLKLWNLESGMVLRILEGHRTSVNSVAVLPDGKRALSASSDCTLKLWDLLTGQLIATFTGDSSFEFCAVEPDGLTIVAGDSAGRVHFLTIEE